MENNNKKRVDFLLDEIDSSWNNFFFVEFGSERLDNILEKLSVEWENELCFPAKEDVFRLFRELSLNKIKVVILGQDPYHQPGTADGFAFSSRKQGFIPASLKNIFIELKNDTGNEQKQRSADLTPWVKEGVFLLNTALTVRQSQQLSHSQIWSEFTSNLLEHINKHDKGKNIIWICWGKEARLAAERCHVSKELMISSVHPSPFSACYGFFGSKPFSRANNKLKENGSLEIDWRLSK